MQKEGGEKRKVSLLGAKIKLLRKKKKYTLKKASRISNLSLCYLWEIENDKVKCPSGVIFLDLAHCFKVTSDYLIDDNIPLKDGKDVNHAIDTYFFNIYRKQDNITKKRIRDTAHVLMKST